MEAPEQEELDLGPIDWDHDPVHMIRKMLVTKGYSIDSLQQISMSRYTLQGPLGAFCCCCRHNITVHEALVLQSCHCNVQVLGVVSDGLIYETSATQHNLRYSRSKARPMRVPEGCKFIGLKSDTGTGKNKQIDVLLHALLYGKFNRYHTETDKNELTAARARLGAEPGVIFIGPRYLYDLEMVRKLQVHHPQLYKDRDIIDDAPVWVWQFHSLWKFDKRSPRIVVIDEAELNLKVFTDTLNKTHQFQNQEMLEFLIKNADLVIVADATLNQNTIDVIRKIDPKGKWFVQNNEFRSNTGAVVRSHDTLESITNRCVADMTAGKVVAIPSGSLSKLEEFRKEVCKRLPETLHLKYKTYNSKTPGREEDFTKGLDQALEHDFTMLLYTGSMGVGVEYTLEHVDKRYLLVNYNLVGADGYLQLLGRIRKPIDPTVEIFVAKPSLKQCLPTSREAIRKQIETDLKSNKYIKTYFHPYMDPSTRKTVFRASKPWVEEALINNTVQRNRSLNNMQVELFTLLQGTGFTIQNVHDEIENTQQGTVLGCDGVDATTEVPEILTQEEQNQIEQEINKLSSNECLDLNLSLWPMHQLTKVETLRKKYVRYRVDFPQEPQSMQSFELIEGNRDVLFNLACVYKLPDQTTLHNYLLREKYSVKLESMYNQITALKIIFGALTKDSTKGAHATPPERLEGRVLEENMQQILKVIDKTGLLRLMAIRLRNNKIWRYIRDSGQTEVHKQVKPVMGLLNQATKQMFGFTYKQSHRTQANRNRNGTWKLVPAELYCGYTVIDIAKRSTLCDDISIPGHPLIPEPVQE